MNVVLNRTVVVDSPIQDCVHPDDQTQPTFEEVTYLLPSLPLPTMKADALFHTKMLIKTACKESRVR